VSPVDARYLEDASGFTGHAERLFAPTSPEELAAVLAEASSSRTAVTVAGAGTGLTGGRVAQGGWIVSTENFTQLEIDPGRAITGAGVLLRDLQAAAVRTGQFYAPDPTEWTASVGGAIACNASGSRSFLYGSTRRHIRSLTAAFLDGSVRTFRRGDAIDFAVPAIPLPRTTKNTAGYPLEPGMDWIDLLTGSEGTLAVVCEAELQLLPAPGARLTGVVFFPGEAAAIAAVDAWRGIEGLTMVEYVDRASLRLLAPRVPEIPTSASACLFFEQIASDADEWIDRLQTEGANVEASWFAASAADRERFRRFRHALPEVVNDTVRRNGFQKLGSDYAVPIENNREMLTIYRRILDPEFAGRYVIFGHIGDAHLHVNILPESARENERGKELMIDLARRAVALGGTVSAEHGLGKRKAHLLELQYALEYVEAMQAVKRRLDPAWVLGRGNIFRS